MTRAPAVLLRTPGRVILRADVGIGLIHSFCTVRAPSKRLHFHDLSRYLGKRVFSAVYRRQASARPTLLHRLRDALLADDEISPSVDGRTFEQRRVVGAVRQIVQTPANVVDELKQISGR